MADPSQSLPADQAYTGAQQLTSASSDYNVMRFLIRQALTGLQTATLVRVVAVTPGAVGPVGTVDVQPLVNQLDGEGNAIPHAVVYGLPYCRVAGGRNAVIMDPAVGDEGVAVFASRDISSVKATHDQANPGSLRQFSMSDGIYLMGWPNAAPTQYVQFSPDGITVVSPNMVTVEAPSVVVNASTSATINSPAVNLGGTGGQGVARIGDMVNLTTGLIVGGSTKVKAT